MAPLPTVKPRAESITGPDSEALIGGRYAVDLAQPLRDAGGGQPAFVAIDRRAGRAGLMAVQARPDAPPRANTLAVLADETAPGLVLPLAHGPADGPDGRPAWFVVCPAPAGQPLWPAAGSAPRPWNETDLIVRVLRPAASALAVLASHRLTHRAVRPGNIFADPSNRGGVTLGCAWAAPPAMLQPAQFEPPYVAMCHGAARGEGSIADDVYALGVTVLSLALGRMPLADLDDDAIIQRKLAQGCFQALTGNARLPPLIGDLVKVMLAQDPSHRPPPDLLADQSGVRARQVAARPPRRAPRSLEFGPVLAWDARTLAFAIARNPEPAAKMLRIGVVDHWLRRVLSDSTLAAKVEEAQARRLAEAGPKDAAADARLMMRVVAILDPLAPLCWNGVMVAPDGFGPALAAEPSPAIAGTTLRAGVEEVIACEALADWAGVRADHCDAAALRSTSRRLRALLRQPGWGGGPSRVIYSLNPLLACRSKVLAGAQVARLGDLPAALEAASASAEARAQLPVDREMAAFMAAHQQLRLEDDLYRLSVSGPPGFAALAQLILLARLQQDLHNRPLPGLANWVAALASPLLDTLPGRSRRADRQAALAEAIPAGDLGALAALLDDPAGRAADEQAFREAQDGVRRIDARLAALAAGGEGRAEAAQRLGQEIAGALGLAALAVSAVAAVMR